MTHRPFRAAIHRLQIHSFHFPIAARLKRPPVNLQKVIKFLRWIFFQKDNPMLTTYASTAIHALFQIFIFSSILLSWLNTPTFRKNGTLSIIFPQNPASIKLLRYFSSSRWKIIVLDFYFQIIKVLTQYRLKWNWQGKRCWCEFETFSCSGNSSIG